MAQMVGALCAALVIALGTRECMAQALDCAPAAAPFTSSVVSISLKGNGSWTVASSHIFNGENPGLPQSPRRIFANGRRIESGTYEISIAKRDLGWPTIILVSIVPDSGGPHLACQIEISGSESGPESDTVYDQEHSPLMDAAALHAKDFRTFKETDAPECQELYKYGSWVKDYIENDELQTVWYWPLSDKQMRERLVYNIKVTLWKLRTLYEASNAARRAGCP